MPEYLYEARTRAGKTIKGVMDAENEEAVNTKLKAQQLAPVSVKKKARKLGLSRFGGRVKLKDLVIFTRQFATMIDAGLPLVQCIEILGTQTENKRFGRILLDVKANVEGGATFSDSLKRYPKTFNDLYTNLVAAGELGGILDTIMNRLASYLEKNAQLQRKVKGAMVYPTIVLIVAIGVVSILLTKVIPTFEKMFKDFGAEKEMPAATQFVINLSKGFIQNLPAIVLTLGALITAVVMIYRTKRGKWIFHSFFLVIPILGTVIRKIAVARFTRTLGTLLSSGVPILDALDTVSRSAGNVVVEHAIRFARDRISEGRNMADPLAEAKVFPGMVVQMIAVGEQTGALDQMCNKIADFYDEEVDVAVEALTSMLEPIMMVGLGGSLGFMIIAMYLPIFNLAGAIKGE